MSAAPPLPAVPWLDLAIVLALIALNGLFAMSELAIVSARKPRLQAMAKAGKHGAQAALNLGAEPGRFLSTVQIGITGISVLAGAFSGDKLGGPIGQALHIWGLEPELAEKFLNFIVKEVIRHHEVIARERAMSRQDPP